jgi:hypothetical protein
VCLSFDGQSKKDISLFPPVILASSRVSPKKSEGKNKQTNKTKKINIFCIFIRPFPPSPSHPYLVRTCGVLGKNTQTREHTLPHSLSDRFCVDLLRYFKIKALHSGTQKKLFYLCIDFFGFNCNPPTQPSEREKAFFFPTHPTYVPETGVIFEVCFVVKENLNLSFCSLPHPLVVPQKKKEK